MTKTMRLTSLRAHRAMRARRGVMTTTRAESPQTAREETRGENVSSMKAPVQRARAPVSRYMYPSSPLSNLLAQTSPMTMMQHQIDDMMQMMGEMFGETPMERMLDKFESSAAPGFHRAHVLAPPEMLRKDVAVEIDPEQRVLHISAKRDHRASEEEEEGDVKWLVYERHFGKLERQMKLPEDATIDENEIDCRMVNGLLTVTIPKVEKEESEEDKAPPRLKVPIRDH